MTAAPTAIRKPVKTIRQLEEIFARRAGGWTVPDLARQVMRSEASVREAIRTLTKRGLVRRMGRTQWIEASEFEALVAKRKATALKPSETDLIHRDLRSIATLADDLDKVEARWSKLMAGRRFEDAPRIRPLTLWRGSPDLSRHSITGSAAAMCIDGRGGMVGR